MGAKAREQTISAKKKTKTNHTQTMHLNLTYRTSHNPEIAEATRFASAFSSQRSGL